MTTNNFIEIVKATGKSFSVEQTISGYYQLLCDDNIVFDDSACEEVNGSEEEALDFFAMILLNDYVPSDKKVLKGGLWMLKK